jgi:DNA-binding response OmpR family regulator
MPARIVIVENDEATQYILNRLLAGRGYDVEVHGSAEAAMASVRCAAPSLVITDLRLPGVSGIELTRMVRADPTLAGVKIIVLTMHAEDADRAAGLAAGVDVFMMKPVDWQPVLDVVEDALRPSMPRRPGH